MHADVRRVEEWSSRAREQREDSDPATAVAGPGQRAEHSLLRIHLRPSASIGGFGRISRGASTRSGTRAIRALAGAGVAGVLRFLLRRLGTALLLAAALLAAVLAALALLRQRQALELRQVHALQPDHGFQVLLMVLRRRGIGDLGFLGEQAEVLARVGLLDPLLGGAFSRRISQAA